MENVDVRIDYQAVVVEQQQQIDALKARVEFLEDALEKAKKNAYKWEAKYQEFADALAAGEYKKVPTKEERKLNFKQKQQEKVERMLRGTTSQGKKLATSAEAINSYTDFCRVRDWLENNTANGTRNATFWTLGCSLGIRVSDVVRLKWYHFFDADRNWRERIPIMEVKTSKINNALITESIRLALEKHIREDFPDGFDLSDWVFPSQKWAEHITEKYMYKLLIRAQEALGIKEHLGTHAMRKTFVKIIECKYNGSYNEKNLAIIQQLLNHESATTTSRYLGEMKNQCDGARRAVSDFLLGKSGDVLERPQVITNDDLYELIKNVEKEIATK